MFRKSPLFVPSFRVAADMSPLKLIRGFMVPKNCTIRKSLKLSKDYRAKPVSTFQHFNALANKS